MANIFLQLTSQFRFKRQTLEDITGASTNKKVQKVIEDFYESGKTKFTDYANLFIDLLSITTAKDGKDKLFIALVYFIVHVSQQEGLRCLTQVLQSKESVISKVKFFSFVFKSSNNLNLKKWLIKNTVILIQNQQKVSSYAGIIEHFDQLIEPLNITRDETFQIYVYLISYLEKHPVYKKICSVYVVKCLQQVTQQSAKNKETTDLIIKVIRSGVISDNALSLLNHEALKKNELYPILEVLLTGDFQKLDLNSIKKLEKDGLVGEQVLRKMKIQAIPRLLSNVKVASYDQVAQRLNIKKEEVQSYIIDAIKQGVIKAKLDQYDETVIINRLNFRALRLEQRAKLQKDISTLVTQLSQNLKQIS